MTHTTETMSNAEQVAANHDDTPETSKHSPDAPGDAGHG